MGVSSIIEPQEISQTTDSLVENQLDDPAQQAQDDSVHVSSVGGNKTVADSSPNARSHDSILPQNSPVKRIVRSKSVQDRPTNMPSVGEMQNVVDSDPTGHSHNPILSQKSAGKRSARSKSMYGNRVHLRMSPQQETGQDPPRRSNRIKVPTNRFNYGTVFCCVCKKQFRQDIPLNLYTGSIVCSIECFKRD